MDNSKIIEAISKMSIIELNDLVKEIEKHFGVSAAVAVAAAVPSDNEAAAVPTSVTLTLKEFGTNKIAVIKMVREVLGLGLMESKSLVEKAPVAIKENIKPEEANELAEKFKAAGAVVEVK